MEVSISTRQAYSEIEEFLLLLTEEQRNKVPKKLRKLFSEEKDFDYYKGINPTMPIKDQKLKEETLAIIALLNLHYWCEDEAEKEKLREIYARNDEDFKILQQEFIPDKVFKQNKLTNEKVHENELTIKNNNNKTVLGKIIGRLKKIFR